MIPTQVRWPLPPDRSSRLLRAGVAFAAGLAVGLGTISTARAEPLQQQCDAAELHAMSKRLRDDAACMTDFAFKPQADPGESVLGLCRGAARGRFEARIEEARQTAEAEGVECSTSLAGIDPDQAALETTEALAEVVLAGWDPDASARPDDKLRARLLREVAKLAKRHMKAESKHRLAPDNDHRQRRLAKAEIRFELATEEALDRASAKGVLFAATDAALLRSQLMTVLDTLADEMTAKADPPVNPGPTAGPVIIIKAPLGPFL